MEAFFHSQTRLDQHEQALVQQGENFTRQREALTRQREDLVRHDQTLQLLGQAGAVQQQPPAPDNSAPPSHSAPEPRLSPPQRYNGDPGGCRGFFTQCKLNFELRPITFPTDRSRIAFVITALWNGLLLSGTNRVLNALLSQHFRRRCYWSLTRRQSARMQQSSL